MGPLVSVVMASYNHEGFVAPAIESVLRQRDVELELLVADDGSTDGSRGVVASVRDDRLHFFPSDTNRGACVVTNELIQRASGEFIAVINSDDEWIGDDKLARQRLFMESHPRIGACFGRVRFVDRGGRTIDKSALPYGRIFDQKNRSPGVWLRRFFDLGNCLCHPTMMIRRSCYDSVGMYDNRLRQLPDFDMWVRLLKRYDIHVSHTDMIAFRQLPGENASAVTAVNSRRGVNELYFILRRFFDGISPEVLLDGFRDLLVHPDLVADDAHLDIELALLYGQAKGPASRIHNLVGLEKLHGLLGSDTHRPILASEYGIDDRTFQAVTGEVGALDDPVEALEKQLAYLNEALHAFERSASWRVTAPLRRIRKVMRKP